MVRFPQKEHKFLEFCCVRYNTYATQGLCFSRQEHCMYLISTVLECFVTYCLVFSLRLKNSSLNLFGSPYF